jgi:hypothetical protein
MHPPRRNDDDGKYPQASHIEAGEAMTVSQRTNWGITRFGLSHLLLVALATFGLSGAALCQTSAPYQIGTVMEVKDHQPTAQEDSTKRYDISVKVGNILYIVLYTPRHGSDAAEYKTGLDFPVQVDGKTLRFNDTLGRPVAVPIVSRTQLPVDSKPPKPD